MNDETKMMKPVQPRHQPGPGSFRSGAGVWCGADTPLCVMIDALDVAVGAALHERVDDTWQPLQPAETRYSTFGRELLAVYVSIRHFRHFLEGRTVFVLTDHKPLTYALHNSTNRHSPREIRHLDFISQFICDLRNVIKHRLSDTFTALRRFCSHCSGTNHRRRAPSFSQRSFVIAVSVARPSRTNVQLYHQLRRLNW